MLCEICGRRTAVQKHHITYFPERTTGVCEGCHRRIHSGSEPGLTARYVRYRRGDARLFYSQKARVDEAIRRICRSRAGAYA